MEPRRTAVQRTHRTLLLILGVLFLVLLGTGLWLTLRYQPSGRFEGAHPQSWIRDVHRNASRLFLFVALAVLGISIAMSVERALKRGVASWVVGVVIMLGAIAAALSGYLLPWDQLALAPLRPGQYRGYEFLFGHSEVKFVLVGSYEVGKATVLRWFFVHTAAIPVALVVLGVVAWRLTRRSRLVGEDAGPTGS